jgi:dihydroflavonol-4-reductase
MNNQTVLLTGVTGFLGSRTTIDLLNLGYQVRGTLRDMNRADSIRALISQHTNRVSNLELVEADLTDEKVWDDLMTGIDYVQHIASPFPQTLPEHEDDLILPARNGTLAVLKAAKKSNVKRVVLTSSTGAIIYGKQNDDRSGNFDETDWTDLSNQDDLTPYFKSKTIAEQAAWDYVKSNSGIELSVVCPGAILGPVLESDYGTSANMVLKIMDGSSPAIPKIGFDVVDVRSVSDLLIRAMTRKEAANERFIASSGFLSFKEVAEILRGDYPDKKIPRWTLPNFMVKLFAQVEPSLKPILIDLGHKRTVDHSKAEKILGWSPIGPPEAVRSCAKSLIHLNLV